MSKNYKPRWQEPVAAIIVEEEVPLEDTIEVGVVVLADGPLDPVPLSEGPRDPADYTAPRSSVGAMPDFSTSTSTLASGDKGTADVAQNTKDAVQGVADKAKSAASDAADKAKDTAAQVQDKAKDTVADVADKAKDAAGKIAASVSDASDTAKETVTDAADKAKSLSAKIGGATTSGARSAGTTLWNLVQRSPLQALVFLGSLIWLVRHNQSAASAPPVSINDAAGKVGTAAGQVQGTLNTLGSQVKEQAQHGQGWFSKTLQDSPLVIGAMALIAGAALGLSVPETSYEDKLLGGKRDELVGKVQDAAQDLTQKVTTVAQTAVHDAVESVKEEAKNQGLAGEIKPEDANKDLADLVGKVQEAAQKVTTVAQAATQSAVEGAKDEAKNQGLTGDKKPEDGSQDQSQG